MITIVSCLRSLVMTSAEKIDRKIDEKTVVSIEGKIAETIGKSIGARIAETRHDQTQAVSCEGLIGPIMSPATMDGKGERPPVRLKWIGRTDRGESNDRKKLKDRNDRTVRRDQKSLSDLNGLSVPSGRKNRNERDEIDENRVRKLSADRLLKGKVL